MNFMKFYEACGLSVAISVRHHRILPLEKSRTQCLLLDIDRAFLAFQLANS